MANLEKLYDNNFVVTDEDSLFLDPEAHDQLRKNMLASISALNLKTEIPFGMEHEMNGTESSQLLINHWHKVAATTLNFKNFYINHVDPTLVNVAKSIDTTANDVSDQLIIEDPAVPTSGKSINQQSAGAFAGVTAAINNMVLEAVNSVTDFARFKEDFVSRYNVDDETWKTVAAWIEDYKNNGNTEYIEKLKEYQNLSASDWENLTDEQYKEFTALTTLYAWTGYVVEHGDENTEDIDVYKTISSQLTSNMYSTNKISENSDYVEASIDSQLVYAMKTALSSLGASDSLAYNILSKVENDGNSYIVYDPQYQPTPKDVSVVIDYDESGFVSVNIEDSYVTDYPLHTRQFLAAGKDEATSYMKTQRDSVDQYSNHGMTNGELIAMFQSVENPNDLQIMTNIAISDNDFKINGEGNAFDIDYWEYDTSHTWNYTRGVSDSFSVALAQMSSTILYREDYDNYKSFINATVESSINDSDHNILLDIASGAGVYVDTCSLAVVNDVEGGTNDEFLRKQLNAANANYGAFSQLYTKFEDDVTYSNLNISDILYSSDAGTIDFSIQADTKTGILFWAEEEEGINIKVDTKIEHGKQATNDQAEGKQAKLLKELERKKEDIIVDAVIDLTGNINPLLKDGIYFVKDASDNDASLDSANIVRDGMKAACSENKNFNRGLSGAVTILGAISKYEAAIAEYEKAKEECNDTEKLQTFYSYNTGSGTVGLYSYDCIRKIQAWNKNGIYEIVGASGKKNDDIYNAITDGDGNYTEAVINVLATDLCDKSLDYLGPTSFMDDDIAIQKAYREITNITGYTKEDIDSAMQVLIYGYNENGLYHEVTDIPFDLMNACVDAISDETGADVNVYRYWEDYVDEYVDKVN